MSKQAWYYDNGAVWQAWGSDAVEMICGPIDELRGKSIVADHNALLNIPDPEAYMAAHEKLFAACEHMNKIVILNADKSGVDFFIPVFNAVNQVSLATEALAAVKAAQFPVQVPSEGTVTGVNVNDEHRETNIPVCKDDDIGKIAGDAIEEPT